MKCPSSETLRGLFLDRGWSLATAESCTGGLLGNLITDRPGSSEFYLGGVVAYSNRIKTRILGVGRDLLKEKGAVSPETARAMARGARKLFRSSAAAAITGIAGPGGGTPEKPVGLVFISVSGPDGETVEKHNFRGSRAEIKRRASQRAIEMLIAAAELRN